MDADRPEPWLSVGQMAARSGVPVSTLHFYEKRGLIASRRTPGNQRRYDRSMLRRVAVVRAAQSAGIPLTAVSRAFDELPQDSVPGTEDWLRLSEAWRTDIDRRLAHLQNLRDRLGGCISCGCLSLDECGFVNPGDRSGRAHSGADV